MQWLKVAHTCTCQCPLLCRGHASRSTEAERSTGAGSSLSPRTPSSSKSRRGRPSHRGRHGNLVYRPPARNGGAVYSSAAPAVNKSVVHGPSQGVSEPSSLSSDAGHRGSCDRDRVTAAHILRGSLRPSSKYTCTFVGTLPGSSRGGVLDNRTTSGAIVCHPQPSLTGSPITATTATGQVVPFVHVGSTLSHSSPPEVGGHRSASSGKPPVYSHPDGAPGVASVAGESSVPGGTRPALVSSHVRRRSVGRSSRKRSLSKAGSGVAATKKQKWCEK